MDEIKTKKDREKHITVHTVSGYLNADYYIEKIEYNLDKTPTKYVVWDFSNADISNLTSDDLKRFIEISTTHPNAHILKKIAKILPNDLSFGLGRMFEIYNNIQGTVYESRPFRKAEDAFKWLGVPDIRKSED